MAVGNIKFNPRQTLPGNVLPKTVTAYRASEKPWDRWRIEQEKLGILHLRERKKVEKCIKALRKDQVVLDVGTGTGKILSSLLSQKNVRKVIGIDVNRKALSVAKRKLKIHPSRKKLSLILGNADAIPIQNGSVSCVVGIGLFSEISEMDKTLLEIRRVLKRSGILIGDFDAKETFKKHMIKRRGYFSYLYLTMLHEIAKTFSFWPRAYNYLGRKGIIRLMPYTYHEANDMIGKYFNIKYIQKPGYYHFFVASKK